MLNENEPSPSAEISNYNGTEILTTRPKQEGPKE